MSASPARYLLRPADEADLPALGRFKAAASLGVDALPGDDQRLGALLEASLRALALDGDERGGTHLFMLDTLAGETVGCAGLEDVGERIEPFYSLRRDTFVHASVALDKRSRASALSVCHDLAGATRLTRQHLVTTDPPLLELALRGRLAFAACHPGRFADELVAELPGMVDARGRSPFWEAIGRHFFGVELERAEQLCSRGDRLFLSELLPLYPLYESLMPASVREAIGVSHPRARATERLLLEEGLEKSRYFDVFDTGPSLVGRFARMRTLCAKRTLELVKIEQASIRAPERLISNARLAGFRAMFAAVDEFAPGQARLDAQSAAALGLARGDRLTVA
ncbi:arginine N-succinyltransferase [Halotalea alkalilenta]|uniref:arginine N-succinyltransferase n=1 Tax=Halotalea alkalilenta TaxID=376489 RepID=UPI0004826D7B|nr:arginine N-succinyltransferase [Halotalea alkalilenta]